MATKRPPHVIENLRRLHEESRALLESIADRLRRSTWTSTGR